MFSIDNVHPIHQLIISITLGLFVGLQRQWADSPIGGVRTFSLTCLTGTLTGFLFEKLGPLALLVSGLGIIIFTVVGSLVHFKSNEKKLGLSTEVSMLVMFLVGVLIITHPIWIAVSAAGALAIILQSKMELHEFATRFSAKELKSIMQFVLFSFIIFPIVPNRTIDPMQVINLHDIWIMVILIVGLGLSGYIGYKFFGSNAGILLSGILGGTISSTATTVSYSKSTKYNSTDINSASTIILIAWTMVYLRLCVEIFIVAPGFTSAYLPLLILFLVSTFCSLWLWLKSRTGKSEMLKQENPSELRVALIFAIIYGVISFAVSYARKYWGEEALFSIAFISGITDMDAITLSTANLVQGQLLDSSSGWKIIIIAALSNTLFKGAIIYIFGQKELFKKIFFPMIITIVFSSLILLIGRF